MTNPPTEEPQFQWQQPKFDQPTDGVTDPIPTVTGRIIVKNEPTPPPSRLESTVNVVAGLVWPVAILLAILGYGGFFLNVVVALIISSALKSISRDMKRRRNAS